MKVRRARVQDAGGIARVSARAFYARFGFTPDGTELIDSGTGLDEIRLRAEP